MIIFLYGEDNFRSMEKLKQLETEFFKKNNSNANSSVFDFSDSDFNTEIKSAIRSRGLFSEKSLIKIKNFLSQNDLLKKDELIKFFKKNSEYIDSLDIIIIFWENNKPKKNDAAFKWLVNNAKNEEFLKLNERQLGKWVEERFLALDIKIDIEIIDKIILNKNSDLFYVDREIAKISNFIGKSDAIDGLVKKQIFRLIDSSTEANIFRTIELLSAGNKKEALKMLQLQLSQGDDPFYILSMYIYQFRNLLKIAEHYFGGKLNYSEIAKIIKLHPFVVQKGIENLKNSSFEKILLTYKKLEKIDQDAKSGKTNIELGLDLLIADW